MKSRGNVIRRVDCRLCAWHTYLLTLSHSKHLLNGLTYGNHRRFPRRCDKRAIEIDARSDISAAGANQMMRITCLPLKSLSLCLYGPWCFLDKWECMRVLIHSYCCLTYFSTILLLSTIVKVNVHATVHAAHMQTYRLNVSISNLSIKAVFSFTRKLTGSELSLPHMITN